MFFKKRYYFLATLAFIAYHMILLHFYPFRIIDVEELEYGEFAASWVLGFSKFTDIFDYLFIPREGSLVTLTPLLIPFFMVFEPSLYTLKLAAIFLCSTFIIIWGPIIKKVYPEIPPSRYIALFVIPFPLLQIASLSIYSIMTHLGSVIWFGLTLNIIFCYSRKRSPIYAALLGFVINIAIFSNPSYLGLLPGIFYCLWKNQLIKAPSFIASAILFSLIPLSNLLIDPEVTRALSLSNLLLILMIACFFHIFFLLIKRYKLKRNLDEIFQFFRSNTVVLYATVLITLPLIYSSARQFLASKPINNLLQGLVYKFDFQAPFLAQSIHTESNTKHLLFASVSYGLILLVFTFIGKKKSAPTNTRHTSLSVINSVFLSSVFFIFLLLITDAHKSIAPNTIDGMRYFTILLPAILLVFIQPLTRLSSGQQRAYIATIIGLNLIGSSIFLYPFNESRLTKQTRGYLSLFPLISSRINHQFIQYNGRYDKVLPWYGARAFTESLSSEYKESIEIFNMDEKNLFWIGHGIKQNIEKQQYFDPSANTLNCLFPDTNCPLPQGLQKIHLDAIKLGWLIATPCQALKKAFKHWDRTVRDIKKILLSKPDYWECSSSLPPEKILQLFDGKSHLASNFDHLLPLKASKFTTYTSLDTPLKEYSTYIGWNWFLYLKLNPGDNKKSYIKHVKGILRI